MPDIMGAADIAFPHLGIYLHNVPKQFTVFNYTIALYACIIAAGMMLGVALCEQVAKRTGQEKPDVYWDICVPLVLLSVCGARVYYVIFMWDEIYRYNPIHVFYIHEGGLAIYGGVLTGFLVLLVCARVKKVNYFTLTDTVMFGLLTGQSIGRWGNFTNREVFGGYTDSLFAMRLPIEAVRGSDIPPALADTILEGTNYIQVHPTFLYESAWNLCLLILLLLYVKHKKFEGEIILLYLGGYGLGRAMIEHIRTDQLYITGTRIPVSEVLAIVMIIFAVLVEIIVRARLAGKAKRGNGTLPEESAAPEVKAGAVTASEAVAELEPGAEAEAETEPKPGAEAVPETETDTETETKMETEAKT